MSGIQAQQPEGRNYIHVESITIIRETRLQSFLNLVGVERRLVIY